MGGQPKETTTKVEPWGGAQGYLTDVYKQYDQLIKSGAPKQWSGSTVADQSQATKDAQSGLHNYASNAANSNGIKNAQGTVNDITTGGAFGTTAQDALKSGTMFSNPAIAQTNAITNGIKTNYVNPAAGQAANLNGYTNAASGLQTNQATNLATAYNPALANLQKTAAGSNIGANPYLEQAVANSNQKIAEQLGNVTLPTIQGQAAGMGRLGSNASASLINNATSTAADAMSKNALDMYQAQYNNDVSAMLQANNQVASAYNSDVSNAMNANANLATTNTAQQGQRIAGTQLYGNLNQDAAALNQAGQGLQLQGAGQAGQLGNAQQDLRNSAASSLWSGQNAQANTQLGAAGMAGDMYGMGLLPYETLLGLGQSQDTRAQDILNNTIQRYEQNQQQQLTNYGNFANVLNGGGYSNTTTPVYNNTAGQMLGGLGSALGALVALCDVRTKQIIRQIGAMPLADGSEVPMYEFTYTDDPDQKLWVGPVAQEVEAAIPNSTMDIEGRKYIITNAFMEAA
ncbi:tail fiber domain-containing protein [Rhizobium sp. Leaf262]|uniref:tail fiber domain-containing protein n=1 Tax=Rhizobium sp. Leaf262 TaxID=1736312 RepID=UPI00071370C0|nr:tail fiber domain-containing protein [Rhizobium sp. Leaf262]KQO79436.1 hypothetical protein ASF29_23280 [Rhizobium sp. Leaf262]